jgi:hypothetical protein
MPRGYKKNLNKEQQLGVSKIELRGGGSTSRNSAKKKGSKPIAKSIYTDLSICRRRAGKLRRKLEALDTLDCDICETVDDIYIAKDDRENESTTKLPAMRCRDENCCRDQQCCVIGGNDLTANKRPFNEIAIDGLSSLQQKQRDDGVPLSFVPRLSALCQKYAKDAVVMMKIFDFKVVGMPEKSSSSERPKLNCGANVVIENVPWFKIVPKDYYVRQWYHENPQKPQFEFDGLEVVNQYFQAEPVLGLNVIDYYLRGEPFSCHVVERHYRGCATCEWRWEQSFGYNGNHADEELKVLPALEANIANLLSSHPMKRKLLEMISQVYEIKDHIREFGHITDWEYEDIEGSCEVVELHEKAALKTRDIANRFKICIRDDEQLALLSCAVYKSCLQQNDAIPAQDWYILKNTISSKRVNSIEIIFKGVCRFLESRSWNY